MLAKLIVWINSLVKAQYNPKISENNENLYISQKLIDHLNDYLTSQTTTPEINSNLLQIKTIVEKLNEHYAKKELENVAVNIRKFSDFTKTIYNVESNPLSDILKSKKWIRLYALSDAKNLQRIDQKLEVLHNFEEIDSSREFANSELHVSSNTRQLIIDIQMLPSQQAINFLVNIAIEGANYQEPKNASTTTIKWESIFESIKITDKAREELEKTISISKDKRPLDKYHEQQTISDDIVQYLFNHNTIQYIDENSDVFKLLKLFWTCDWDTMRKMINTQLSKTKKKKTPLIYFQLKLSKAWILFQLGKSGQAIKIWLEVEKECPKDYPHIRKLILNNLRSLLFTEYHDSDMDKNRYNELQQYEDIVIVDSNIRFNKSNILSTINKEFDFKNGKTRSLGQETRQFFLYIEYLPHWTRSISTVLEKGMFFMLPELVEDLIDLSITQYQYYGEGNKRYFFMLHSIAHNIYRFNTICLKRYFNILELWDLQNYIEEIQPLVNNILSSELKSIDLKFLKIIAPILNPEQQSKITQYARNFFENPKVPYGDNYNTFGLWGEYLITYFAILELNQSLWENEQEWIITTLCNIEVIEHNNSIPYIERLIKKTKFPLADELFKKLIILIEQNRYKTIGCISSKQAIQKLSHKNLLLQTSPHCLSQYITSNKMNLINYNKEIQQINSTLSMIEQYVKSEYELISEISSLYTFYNKKLPTHYQEVFRKHESLWLYTNHNAVLEVTSENIAQAFKYIEYIINEFYDYYKKLSMGKKDEFTFKDEYYSIPQYISLYLSLIEEYKDKIDYELLHKDVEKLWIEFLDFCMIQNPIPFKLLLEVQSSLIYFASENKFEKYHNVEYYVDFDKWKDKVNNYSMHNNDQKNRSSMIFLNSILHHIYGINDVDMDSFHRLLNTIPWHQYHYCLQGIINWKEAMPQDIKQLLKIKLLDIISLSQRELISTNVIFVYKMVFTNEEDVKSLQQFKGVCSFPLYYEINK